MILVGIVIAAIVLVCIAAPPTSRTFNMVDQIKLGAAVGAVFLGLIVVAWAPKLLADYRRNTSHRKLEEVARTAVNEWLEAQRRGQTGYEFWTDESQAVRFFAVQEWEITDELGSTVIVRVSSSNRGGVPIVALWRVYTDGGKIRSVEEAVPTVDPELERAREGLLRIERELKAGMKY